MRRRFDYVLQREPLDLKSEYSRIYSLFYEVEDPLSVKVDSNFLKIPFRSTCIDLADFNRTFQFNFEKYPQRFSVNYLVNFCEYVYNLILNLHEDDAVKLCLNQIERVVDKIGYMRVSNGSLTLLVPKESVNVAGAEAKFVKDEDGFNVLEYRYSAAESN